MSLIPLGFWAASGGGGASDLQLLETQTLVSLASSVTFTGLGAYSDYKHLQIRAVSQANLTGTNILNLQMRFNSDSGNNYANHRLVGNGTNVQSAAGTSSNTMILWRACERSNNQWSPSITDILDFSNANKNTTIRTMAGGYASSEKAIALSSNVWMQTSPVTTIYIDNNASVDFTVGSRFSLYGIKG